jgi:hypothetical protein
MRRNLIRIADYSPTAPPRLHASKGRTGGAITIVLTARFQHLLDQGAHMRSRRCSLGRYCRLSTAQHPARPDHAPVIAQLRAGIKMEIQLIERPSKHAADYSPLNTEANLF